MLQSLALIFLVGLAFGRCCQFLKLPRIIGMLAAGILLGPYVCNLLDASILDISGDLRKIALIIILIKAGLSLQLSDLKRAGRPAILLSFLPACFELLAYACFAPAILHISRLEGALMGAVLAAVSPAVVVPRMVYLMENGYGTKKSIPQMILAGASCDDVFVIVLFSTLLAMAEGGKANAAALLTVPLAIVSGLVLGAVTGILLQCFFEWRYRCGNAVRNSMKVIIILGTALLLAASEEMLAEYLPLSGLLAVVSMACAVKLRAESAVTARLSEKFGKLWIAAEVVLFVLVGAAVDIRYTLGAGLGAILMILLALAVRAAGVFICLLFTKLDRRERWFCVISYLPKATVQAAIGSVPLAAGLACGKLVLSVAVLAILITAPLGATLMDLSYSRLLTRENAEN